MKKYIIIFLAASVCFSCEDFLEETNPNQFSDDVLYQSLEDMRFTLNALYASIEGFPSVSGYNERSETSFIAYTDDGWDRTTRSGGASLLNFTPNSLHIEQHYNNRWDFIRQCNEFIINARNVAFEADSEEELLEVEGIRDRMVAEARFIRAFYYDRLNFLYGHVPLVLEPISYDVYPSRVDRKVVFDWVTEELTQLASELPWTYSGDAGAFEEEERITRGAVLGLLARHALNGVDWNEDFQELYVIAREAAQIVYDNGPYSLEQGIEGFERLFDISSDNTMSKEVIWKSNYDQTNRTHNYAQAILPKGAFSGTRNNNSAYINATSRLIEAFQDSAGLDITNGASVYDPANPWDRRDPRLDATILRRGEEIPMIGGNGNYTFDPFPYPAGERPDGTSTSDAVQGSVATNPCGYYFQKYQNFSFITPQDDQIDYIMMRLPEIILMYAEGLLGESGDIARAMSLVDEVRTRVGMPTVAESYGEVSSINEALNIILQERRFEFACEGPQRYFDIKRYRLGELLLLGENAVTYGIPLGAGGSVDVNVDEGELDDSYKIVAGTRVFNSQTYYLWPIPQDAINANPNLSREPLSEIETFN